MRCVRLILMASLFLAAKILFAEQPGAAARASFIVDEPVQTPRVRPALGVTLGKASPSGVEIAGVMPNSPAADAGLRPGDLVFAIDDVPVRTSRDVINVVARHEPDDKVLLKVDRKGLRGALHAILADQLDVARRAALGVTFSKSAHGGVRILRVVSGSPADKAGLKIGDRILAIDDQPVTSYGEVVRLVGESQPGSDMKIAVDRYGLEGTLHASLTGLPQVFSVPPARVRPPLVAPPVVPSPPIFELTPADIDDQRGYGD
ncbi:MAG TPA: PDZ domain-containing protein [Pirellulales bacterium]|nr:PDZ domain-containing protein [Pirellulales bacterium]